MNTKSDEQKITQKNRVNDNGQKTIFITISRGSLFRNFFQTGVISHLLKCGVRVVILSPFSKFRELFKDYEHPDLIFESLLFGRGDAFKDSLIREFFKGASFNETVHTRYVYRITNADDPPSKLWYPLRMLFFVPIGFIPGFKYFIRWIDIVFNPQRDNDELFEKYKPDLVFATSLFDIGDISVLKGAKRYGVPTVAMPKSWDNMSKLLSSVCPDTLLVWSPFVKKQSIRYQNFKPENIVITGAPQFDIYSDRHALLSRDEFCKRNGLDPNKKIILYGSTGSKACRESHYVGLIKKWIKDETLEGSQLFIRPHIGYIGDIKQFEPLECSKEVLVDRYDAQHQNTRFKDNWNVDKGHLAHIYNSFAHADVSLNVSSTLTIDSTMCGTPVINLYFDLENVGPNMSVKRLYRCDYIKAIIDSGGSWVVRSREELLETLQNILSGTEDISQMKKLIDYLAYKKDGKSAERIVEHLMQVF